MLALPRPAFMRSFRLMLVLAVLPLVSAPGSARQERAGPLAAQRELCHRGGARPCHSHSHRHRPADVAEHLERSRQRSSGFTCTGTPGATRSPRWMREWHLARNQPVAAPPASDLGSIDLTRARRRRPGRPAGRALHRARRWQRAGSDGASSSARAAGRAWRNGRDRSRLDVACAAAVQRDGRSRQLLLHRAVVSQDRRARGRRLELSPVSCRRRSSLPTSASTTSASLCRPAGSSAPRDANARRSIAATARPRIATPRPTSTTSPGRRARTSSNGTTASRTPGLPAVDIRLLLQPEHTDQADRHFSADARRPEVLRRVVRAVSVRPHHYRRSGRARSRPRRAGAPARWNTRRCSRPAPVVRAVDRDRSGSVTVHEAGHQWWHGMVATNEVEHAWMDEGLNTYR